VICLDKFEALIKKYLERHKKRLPILGGILLLLIIYSLSKTTETIVHIYHSDKKPDFKDGKIFGSEKDLEVANRDAFVNKMFHELQQSILVLNNKTQSLDEKIKNVTTSKPDAATAPSPSPTVANSTPATSREVAELGKETGESAVQKTRDLSSRIPKGQSIISFPVKEQVEIGSEIILPPGSYVKAKVMSGVQAPEGKTLPSLLELDYAYILPNHKRLDLTGCFMIAKAQGDLSTERVQMQASKLSCVSKTGKMFERDVNGFIADDKDNNFAVEGIVNSKQDRVAAMAFLSSIVEGVSKAVQQAQTTQQTTPLGGSQAVVTGDQATYLAAGGAAGAASQVTQWYLKHAEALLPTISISSGHDIWIVMQESVKLPSEFFRKNDGGKDAFSYLRNLIE
jgi:conjugal transfer pilus assembly protein TraB